MDINNILNSYQIALIIHRMLDKNDYSAIDLISENKMNFKIEEYYLINLVPKQLKKLFDRNLKVNVKIFFEEVFSKLLLQEDFEKIDLILDYIEFHEIEKYNLDKKCKIYLKEKYGVKSDISY